MPEGPVFVLLEVLLDCRGVVVGYAHLPGLLALVRGWNFHVFREALDNGVDGFPFFDGEPEGPHFVFQRRRGNVFLTVTEVVAALPAVEVIEIV